jgi:hypothetical protein
MTTGPQATRLTAGQTEKRSALPLFVKEVVF